MPTHEENKTKTIFDFIKEGVVDKVEQCVQNKVNINEHEKSKDKFTPLHCAAYYGSLECLHWLLWQGADSSATTPKGWTPAHVAAIRGQYSCIQALIKNGINVNARDHRGQTPAHLAATHGHSHTLQAIIRGGADVNLQDANGWTPVHAAAYHGRLGCLQFLKSANGKLDECDNDGNTPAHLAAMEGNLPCLKYILCNAINTGALLAARNDQGDTPKTLAQQFYKTETVEYLEAVEWDRDHPEHAENLAFPAHVAAFNGDLDHIKLLVEQGVININERDDKNSTMAHKAAGQGHIHVLQWLIENGADFRVLNQSGETAQDVAKRFAQLAAIKLLESVTGLDEQELDEERAENFQSESRESIKLSGAQKSDARARARKRVQEMEKQLTIAKSNYIQLGGRAEDITSKSESQEHHNMKELQRTITELETELEFERVRREKLELQLDNCRQELERSMRMARDYEQKVIVLEKFLQHTAKQESKTKKQQARDNNKSTTGANPHSPSKLPRSRSQQSNKKDGASNRAVTPTRKKSVKKSSEAGISSASVRSDSASNRHAPHKKDILDTLTSAQIKELRRAFEAIDKNGSGSISHRELKQAFAYLDIRASDDEIDVVIAQMDTNDDGRVEFEEFARVMARNYYKKHSRDEIIEAFRKFDLNDSGQISAEELRAVLSKRYRFVSRDEIEELIKKADKNKDGLISIQEFADLMNL